MSSQDNPIQKPTSKWLTFAGFSLTIGYIVFVAWYWSDQSSSLAELKPNEFGDFLAGVFAPLAFLWLVLGFLQQGMELRNSADALWLQGEELRNSVEQQRSLVEVTREQLSLERAVLDAQREEIERTSIPFLEIQPSGSRTHDGEIFYNFRLFNHGKSCTDVSVEWSDNGQKGKWGTLSTGDNFELSKKMKFDSDEVFDCIVCFIDSRGLRGEKSFTIEKVKSEFKIITGNP